MSYRYRFLFSLERFEEWNLVDIMILSLASIEFNHIILSYTNHPLISLFHNDKHVCLVWLSRFQASPYFSPSLSFVNSSYFVCRLEYFCYIIFFFLWEKKNFDVEILSRKCLQFVAEKWRAFKTHLTNSTYIYGTNEDTFPSQKHKLKRTS